MYSIWYVTGSVQYMYDIDSVIVFYRTKREYLFTICVLFIYDIIDVRQNQLLFLLICAVCYDRILERIALLWLYWLKPHNSACCLLPPCCICIGTLSTLLPKTKRERLVLISQNARYLYIVVFYYYIKSVSGPTLERE